VNSAPTPTADVPTPLASGDGAAILAELGWREQIAQSTDPGALSATLEQPTSLYIGFDPTASSLHVGSLVQILTLRRFQLAGHRPIALVGGATGLIGDPSGRSDERVLNDNDTVNSWTDRLRDQISPFLDFEGPAAATMVNNLDWTREMGALEFLRDIGKHFSVSAMLGKESVSSRIGSGGISFTEFSYMLLQAYDYLELYRRHGCRLQVGGTDQWGNITAGLDLIRKVDSGAGGPAHALTVPLLTMASGAKFGKTATGTVWLDPERTSPYAFYQFWVQADDRDVIGFLRTFTFLTQAEIDELAISVAEKPAVREAQRRLALEVTTLVHGADECERVIAASQALFGRGELGALSEATLTAATSQAPQVAIPAGELPLLVDLLAESGLVPSKSAARRAIREGGAYLNNQKIVDEDAKPSPEDFLHGRFLVLRRGRRDIAVAVRSGG
jgi:tyrosyl-tRNA synthetase